MNFRANATDDYPDHVYMSYSLALGSPLPRGETNITATATDQASNSATCKFKVVHD